MYKKVKLGMLPTNEKADIWLDNFGSGLYNCSTNATGIIWQHLYILSDEEIKEGDWCLSDLAAAKPFKCNNLEYAKHYNCKKIIATTDSSLKVEIFRLGETAMCSLPQPSQSFIEKYIDEYNKGNVITDVMVEYWAHTEENIQYKINPKDNTITIKKVKDSWTREEVLALIDDYIEIKDNFGINRNKWIEDNL